MRRWAFCQLDSLARCRHEAAMEKALVSLPLNLKETYRGMIASIPTELKSDAIRLLQFLVHSKRPITLAEAREVIVTQIENEPRGFDIKRRLFCEIDIIDYCPSLVTVVHATRKELYLAHFSVKEYLLADNQFEVTTASISITRTCLTYLTDITGSNRKIQRDFPMARCAAELLARHVLAAHASEDIAGMTELGQDNDPGPPRGSRLYYACYIGLVASARELIGKRADVNAQGGEYGNALQAASWRGHEDIVKLLLDNGADVNAQGGEYGNALLAASSIGHEEIVKLLLDNGADVNAQGGYYGNALQAASWRGDQEVVKLLLDKGADVNAQGGYGGNALKVAVVEGHQAIIDML
ncbi:Ankyrin repeat protein [Penicillium desertorum]|uniref:Ankyrin repeat protein n=1 Tax=Penicillium desertorum TaxID=1303715 RepID=A0A9W9WQ10_9EURO|nr:Ankyrin repeat protein [Penicillium desertorum]